MGKNLEERVAALEARNKRVEADKDWETSFTRRFLIICITYVTVGSYLVWLGVSKPWLNAVVPSLGFMLSTLAIQKVKQVWFKNRS